ncbi:MAG: tetratricopeptide (TPR) repeat protein [Arenicella sp.]|jgi:tetratricopeptide (TPR) repeat protein
MANRFVLLMLVVLLVLFPPRHVVGAPDPRSSSEFYLSTFGLLDDMQPLVANANLVFSRLMAVVDKAKPKDPTLVIVNSQSWPWAIALPDNTVILTRGALEICYRGVSKVQGDVRLSMIIAHELAHLAEDDYWHRDIYLTLADNEDMRKQEVFSFIGQRSGFGDNNNSDWLNAVRDREIRADDKGFLYASIAGFDVSNLIDLNGQSFFQYWKTSTGNSEDGVHLTAKDRTAFIAARYRDLSNMSEAFHLGLGLIYFNQLDVAEDVYKLILEKFPSHEVFNNLGYINFLQSGILKEGSISQRFWLPSIVDVKPNTAILTRGFKLGPNVDRQKLEKSAYYFSQAVSKNPSYLEGNLNLATANFYLGKFNAAISILREIENEYPDNASLQEIIVLASYNDLGGKVDLTGHVEKTLKNLIAKNPKLASAKFNLAQLYTLWGKPQKAKALWQELSSEQAVPQPYWARVVSQAGDSAKPESRQNDSQTQHVLANMPVRTMARTEAKIMILPDNTPIFKIDHGNGVIEYRNLDATLFTRYRGVSAEFGDSLVPFLSMIKDNERRNVRVFADNTRKLLLFQLAQGNEVWLTD